MKPFLIHAYIHDNVIKWKHFPRNWPFVRGIHRSPVNSPPKGQWRGALIFFFDLRLNKRLSKQSWGWWFKTLSCPLWRHCNGHFWIYARNNVCSWISTKYEIYGVRVGVETGKWRLTLSSSGDTPPLKIPLYFFMTLSCMEAIQSFISHFNQYTLVDPSWGNIPSWVWQGVSTWFRKLWRRVRNHRNFGNWISWK